MPKSEFQKLKLLYLADMLERETDEMHSLTVQQMIVRLAQQGVAAERKSIYDDLATLGRYGMDIVSQRSAGSVGYLLAHREFELPELKLLVDAVQSCRFLSARKSQALIHKLEGLSSRHEAQALQRQVYVTHRVKSMNESVYYNIDTLQTAIAQDRCITFRYVTWTVQKTQQYRRNGQLYEASPVALVWDNENYYLVAYETQAAALRHYRVDKMQSIAICDTARKGKEQYAELDMALYAQRMFGMFGGVEEEVELQFANRLAGVVIDRFGKDVALVPTDDEHFRVRVRAAVSPQFMGWLASFGAEAKVLAPQPVADAFVETLRSTLAQYGTK